jgi:hypothetical protein
MFLNISVNLQTALAREAHPAEGQTAGASKFRQVTNVLSRNVNTDFQKWRSNM